eukprot:scaffold19434_cov121-Skeletonema_dohrnii-CCMP3373.AAC.5
MTSSSTGMSQVHANLPKSTYKLRHTHKRILYVPCVHFVDHSPLWRKIAAVSMNEECPICLEELFDNEGVARNGEVAKIMCVHLVHSVCLQRAGRSLNPDGRRYGVGGFGPRAGCPLCNQPVSFWTSYGDAASFPAFWIKRILGVLEDIGPNGGPVDVVAVLCRLQADETLTKRQREIMTQGRPFREALLEGKQKYVREEINGGVQNGGYEMAGYKANLWYWNEQDNTIWLYKWGEAPNRIKHAALPPIPQLQQRQRHGKPSARQLQQQSSQWPISGQCAIVIIIIAAAIFASIYFDNGEEITW